MTCEQGRANNFQLTLQVAGSMISSNRLFVTIDCASRREYIDRRQHLELQVVCMDWRHMEDLLKADATVLTELKNLCVWNKTSGGMGTF
jgi:hypothetical protein